MPRRKHYSIPATPPAKYALPALRAKPLTDAQRHEALKRASPLECDGITSNAQGGLSAVELEQALFTLLLASILKDLGPARIVRFEPEGRAVPVM